MRRVALILCIVTGSAGAQWQVSGDFGASHLNQARLPGGTALTLGGTGGIATQRFLANASVLGARTSDDRWTGQAVVVGAVATPAWREWQAQASAGSSLFGQTNLAPTSSVDGLLQLRRGTALRGFALGGGAGATSHNAVWIPVSRGVADAWWSAGDERLSLEAALTRTRAVFGESSIFVDLSARDPNHLDLSGAWRHDAGGWSFGVGGGVRDPRASSGLNMWTSVDAAAWLTPRTSLVFTAGRTLEDLVRGVPRTTYAGISLRLSSLPHVTAFARQPTGARIVISRNGAGVRVEILGVSASRVELRADFTDWNELSLERAGDAWRLERPIAPGLHRVLIRVNGGEWTVPVNLARVEDDLAGTVGLITVP